MHKLIARTCACFLLMLCLLPALPLANAQEPQWKTIYWDLVLQSYREWCDGPKQDFASAFRYRLIDINDDGTPELFWEVWWGYGIHDEWPVINGVYMVTDDQLRKFEVGKLKKSRQNYCLWRYQGGGEGGDVYVIDYYDFASFTVQEWDVVSNEAAVQDKLKAARKAYGIAGGKEDYPGRSVNADCKQVKDEAHLRQIFFKGMELLERAQSSEPIHFDGEALYQEKMTEYPEETMRRVPVDEPLLAEDPSVWETSGEKKAIPVLAPVGLVLVLLVISAVIFLARRKRRSRHEGG